MPGNLKYCPFCGDAQPKIESGPCKFTSQDLFMAQVICGHCCAAGPHYAGEETLEDAVEKASQAWDDAERQPSFGKNPISRINKIFCPAAVLALGISHLFYDGIYHDELLMAIVASLLLGVIIGLYEGWKVYKQSLRGWNVWKAFETKRIQSK